MFTPKGSKSGGRSTIECWTVEQVARNLECLGDPAVPAAIRSNVCSL